MGLYTVHVQKEIYNFEKKNIYIYIFFTGSFTPTPFDEI